MSSDRVIIYKDIEYSLHGEAPTIGDLVPEFDVVAYQRGDTEIDYITRDNILAFDYPTLISVVSSVDTPVGKVQTKKFDDKLLPYSDNAILLSVSSDLPTSILRFFDDEKIENLMGCSDYKNRSFGRNLGLLIEEPQVLSRAVIVLDRRANISYLEIVKEITNEPDYESAIRILDDLVNQSMES